MTDDTYPYEQGDDIEDSSNVVRYQATSAPEPKDTDAVATLQALMYDAEGGADADAYDRHYALGLTRASERLESYFPTLGFTSPLKGACPVQGEAFFRGEGIYLRFRGDSAKIVLLDDDGRLTDTVLAINPQVSGERYNGSLTEQEAVRVFRPLLKQAKKTLKKRAKEQR